MTSITLPAKVSWIDDNVFDDIDKIIVSCLAVEPPNKSGAFAENVRLFVPKESVEKYKSDSKWAAAYSVSPLYPINTISLAGLSPIVK